MDKTSEIGVLNATFDYWVGRTREAYDEYNRVAKIKDQAYVDLEVAMSKRLESVLDSGAQKCLSRFSREQSGVVVYFLQNCKWIKVDIDRLLKLESANMKDIIALSEITGGV